MRTPEPRKTTGAGLAGLAPFLALVAAAPTIHSGFFTDDHALRLAMGGRHRWLPPFYDLYRFAAGTPAIDDAARATGFLPWWSADHLRLHFFRPLGSLLFAADSRLFGDNPVGYHVHTVLWYVALVWAVGRLLRRLFPADPGVAGLGAVAYAVHEAHVQPFLWISCRPASVAAFFSVIALDAYVASREKGGWHHRVVAPFAFALGLATGEVAVGFLGFVAAYEVLGPLARGPSKGAGRMAALVPLAVLLGAYVALYQHFRAGAAESGVYVDPRDLRAYLDVFFPRFPVLLAATVIHLPAELINIAPKAPTALAAFAVVAVIAAATLASLRALPRRDGVTLRWLTVGGALAAASACGGFPGGRVLLLPNVAVAAVVGTLAVHGLQRLRNEGGLQALVRRAVVGPVVVLALVAAPALTPLGVGMTLQMNRTIEAVAHGAEMGPLEGKRVYLVAASDPMVFLYPGLVLVSEQAPATGCVATLSAAKAPHQLTRVDEGTLVLEPRGSPLLVTPFEELYRRADLPMEQGHTTSCCNATLRVRTTDGVHPTSIALEGDLTGPDVVFLRWDGRALRRLELPPVGESVDLPWYTGPSGVF